MTSHSRANRSASQNIVKFMKYGPLIYLNCDIICDLRDVPASIYDRKMDARAFDTIYDIPRYLSRVRSLLEDRFAPIWRKREPTHIRLSGTDRLNKKLSSASSEKMGATGRLGSIARRVCQ